MRKLQLCSIVVCLCLFSLILQAHVILDNPNGGETLSAGDLYTITWHPAPAHPMGDWDLYISLDGPTGTWQELQLDLYPGDTTPTDVPITYDWTVWDVTSTNAYIRVVQDGTTGTWDDISDAAFTIVPEPVSVMMFSLAGLALLKKRK